MQDNVNTLYVTALNPGVNEAMLRGVFDQFGRVSESWDHWDHSRVRGSLGSWDHSEQEEPEGVARVTERVREMRVMMRGEGANAQAWKQTHRLGSDAPKC